MARYIDLDNPEFPKSYYQGNFGNDDFARGWNTCLDAVIHHQPPADVAPRSEVAREIIDEIRRTIDANAKVGLSSALILAAINNELVFLEQK